MSSMLIPPERTPVVLVMIVRKSVSICDGSHARRAISNGQCRIYIFGGPRQGLDTVMGPCHAYLLFSHRTPLFIEGPKNILTLPEQF